MSIDIDNISKNPDFDNVWTKHICYAWNSGWNLSPRISASGKLLIMS